jgi:hypothetical protein
MLHNISAPKIVGILLAFCFVPVITCAQYHLNELGLKAGGGINAFYPFASSQGETSENVYQPVPGFDVTGYYSHYVCGKNYGYHIELGFRHLRMNEERQTSTPITGGANGLYKWRAQMLTAGFYYKWRKEKFHQPKEFCIMVGPKVNVPLAHQLKMEDGNYEAITSSNEPFSLSPVMPGGSLQFWWRRPIDNKYAWSYFICPGIDGFGMPFVDPENGTAPYNVYIYLNVGLTLWNNI